MSTNYPDYKRNNKLHSYVNVAGSIDIVAQKS